MTRRYVRDQNKGLAEAESAARESFRQLYERALSAGGLHVAQGSQLWNVARHVSTNSLPLA